MDALGRTSAREHTFLLAEGVWRATGMVMHEGGRACAVDGSAQVLHRPERWYLEARYGTLAPRLRIAPLEPDQLVAEWVARNAEIGRLHGQFIVMAGTINSLFESEDGRFRGVEYFSQVSGDRYRCRGALFDGRQCVRAWKLDLTRKAGADAERLLAARRRS